MQAIVPPRFLNELRACAPFWGRIAQAASDCGCPAHGRAHETGICNFKSGTQKDESGTISCMMLYPWESDRFMDELSYVSSENQGHFDSLFCLRMVCSADESS